MRAQHLGIFSESEAKGVFAVATCRPCPISALRPRRSRDRVWVAGMPNVMPIAETTLYIWALPARLRINSQAHESFIISTACAHVAAAAGRSLNN